MSDLKIKNITILAFALFFGWILSLPYEGPLLYALADGAEFNGKLLNSLTVFAHFAGLFSGQFLTKDVQSAKKLILVVLSICLLGSLALPIIPVEYWVMLLPPISFFAGIFVTTYAHLIKRNIEKKDRVKALAAMLIGGNIVLIIAHLLVTGVGVMVGFVFDEIILVLTILLVYHLQFREIRQDEPEVLVMDKKTLRGIYFVFSLFIFVITINSGIMFQVIYPWFYEYELLVSIYTNIPYILAVYGLYRISKYINKISMLYAGLAFWGIAFILFAATGKSPVSFVLICTFMLAACGIFDFFWWSVMGNLFEYHKNPTTVFGICLSMNVLGVWVGGLIGNNMLNRGATKESLAFVGLGVVIISMLLVIPLVQKLAFMLGEYQFLFQLTRMSEDDENKTREKAARVLTRREQEIFEHLLEGYTNESISRKMFISENTLKTHNRHIYKKLNVKNKFELIDTWQ